MAAGATYEPIATQTLGTAAASITFSSIPATYTDLRLIVVGTSSVANQAMNLRFNSDTATNYSWTGMDGTGTGVFSGNGTSTTSITASYGNGFDTSVPGFRAIDIFSYANTSVFKTTLDNESQDQNGTGTIANVVGLWRSTSAINAVSLTQVSGTFSIGTTATLYGIKAA